MKAGKSFCPYKDGAGLCCHIKMVPLKTMKKPRCPFNNTNKCKLKKESVSVLGIYNLK